MKKFIYITLIITALTFTLVGCKNSSNSSSQSLGNDLNSQITGGSDNSYENSESIASEGNSASDSLEQDKPIYEDVNVFWKDVEGYWYSHENMLTSFTFDSETNDPLFLTGLMESSASLSGVGKFVDITEDGLYRIMINCPAVIYDDRVQSQEKDAFIYINVSKLNEGVLTIKSHTGETAKWVYAGKNMDEFYENLQSTINKFNNI